MSKYVILISASVSSICGGSMYLFSNMTSSSSKTMKTITSTPDEYIDLPEIFNQFNLDHSTSDNNHDELMNMNENIVNKMENWFPKLDFLIKIKHELDYLKLSQTNDYAKSIKQARKNDEKIDSRQFHPKLSFYDKDQIIIRANNNDNDLLKFDTLNELLIHLLDCTLQSNYQTECANYFTRQALILFDNRINPFFHQDFDHHPHHHHHTKMNDNHINNQLQQYKTLYFQTLLQNIVCNENLSLLLINNGLLIILLKFLHLFNNDDDDLETKHWIARIIAALSQYNSSHKHFYHTGWLGILAEWLRSNDYCLKLESGKTLYNMSSSYTSSSMNTSEKLYPSIYLLYPLFDLEDKQPLEYDIIFIHGLKGGVLHTWRQSTNRDPIAKNSENHTQLWPQQWLADDFPKCRILAVHYNSYLSSWNINCPQDEFTIRDRSVQLIHELNEAGVGKRPIIWITHSMGGLFVKHMLTYCQKHLNENHRFIRQTKGIVFYSVPHRGSEMAVWSQNVQRIIYPSNHVLELQKDSDELLQLNDEFIRLIQKQKIDCLSFGETKPCTLLKKPIEWSALLVPEESANPGIGRFILLPENHFSICKPSDRNAPSYCELKEFLMEILLKEKLKLKNKKKYSWKDFI